MRKWLFLISAVALLFLVGVNSQQNMVPQTGDNGGQLIPQFLQQGLSGLQKWRQRLAMQQDFNGGNGQGFQRRRPPMFQRLGEQGFPFQRRNPGFRGGEPQDLPRGPAFFGPGAGERPNMPMPGLLGSLQGLMQQNLGPRGPPAGFPRGPLPVLAGMPRPRPQMMDESGRWSGFVPEGAQEASWNRTLDGLELGENGWFYNSSDVSVAIVRSRDSQLRDMNFTAASSLYVFGENETMVAVRPGFRRMGSMCFLLPEETSTFLQTENELSARNETVIGAPLKVLMLNATGDRLTPFELVQQYARNPSLLFFCGFSGVVRTSVVNGAMLPVNEERERVLKMITLDTEVHMLVRKRGGGRRPPGFGRRPRFPGNRPFGRNGGRPPVLAQLGQLLQRTVG